MRRATMKQILKRFEQNWNGFLSRWRVVLLVFCIALLTDAFSTIYFMRAEGIDAEMHPMVNLVSRWCGPVIGPLLSAAAKAAAGMVVAVYWRSIAGIILGLTSLVSFWAAWFNLWGHRIYEPAIYSWWPF